jgi:hypothetical protein
MRIRLVVTGDLEKRALGPSLERILCSAGADVRFESFLVPGGALTTNRLPDPSNPALPTPTPVRRLAKALVTETLIPRSKTEPVPDLVVGVDDLELANIHQPHVVTAWVRRAVQEVIAERYSSQDAADRNQKSLRLRCSFHLLVPLAEAYFFGELAALARAGVAAQIPVHRIGTDVEQFETDDPRFLQLAQVRNTEKAEAGYSWWREERHPKRYLEFLVDSSEGLYEEMKGGVRALETLDWPNVGATAQTTQFVRALFEDLSDALDMTNPLGAGTVSKWTYPERTVRRETLTLRNL